LLGQSCRLRSGVLAGGVARGYYRKTYLLTAEPACRLLRCEQIVLRCVRGFQSGLWPSLSAPKQPQTREKRLPGRSLSFPVEITMDLEPEEGTGSSSRTFPDERLTPLTLSGNRRHSLQLYPSSENMTGTRRTSTTGAVAAGLTERLTVVLISVTCQQKGDQPQV
jgi:hypothetical protein